MSYYLSEIKHYVSVDCVIFGFQQGSLNLLLLKRKMEPAQGQWSLMGGFVRTDESVDDAAKRVLAEPGERVISVVYYALINIDEYDREAVYQHNAYWVNIDEVPPLIFDHEEMVALARERMKQKAAREPIGFNLLPKLFTLSRLQSLYEAIYGEAMDKRNFRKRVADMDYIEKTDKIDKESSKRGAALYKFNANAYNRTHTKFKL